MDTVRSISGVTIRYHQHPRRLFLPRPIVRRRYRPITNIHFKRKTQNQKIRQFKVLMIRPTLGNGSPRSSLVIRGHRHLPHLLYRATSRHTVPLTTMKRRVKLWSLPQTIYTFSLVANTLGKRMLYWIPKLLSIASTRKKSNRRRRIDAFTVPLTLSLTPAITLLKENRCKLVPIVIRVDRHITNLRRPLILLLYRTRIRILRPYAVEISLIGKTKLSST